jgi:hypothetical protein
LHRNTRDVGGVLDDVLLESGTEVLTTAAARPTSAAPVKALATATEK